MEKIGLIDSMNTKPLLSINIPTFNRSRFLSAILSAMADDVKKLGDAVEIVILDNCSADDTEDVIADRPWGFDVNYIRNASNIGPQANIHMAHRVGCGRYVWVMGDDDFLKPGQLLRIVETLKKGPELVLLSYDKLTPDRRYIGCVDAGEHDLFISRFDPGFDIEKIDSLIGFLSANIIRREWIEKFSEQDYIALDQKGELAHAMIYYSAIASGGQLAYLSGKPLIQTMDNGYLKHDYWVYVCVQYCSMLPEELVSLGFDSKVVRPFFKRRLLKESVKRMLSEIYRGHDARLVCKNEFLRAKLGMSFVFLLPFLLVPSWLIRFVYDAVKTKRA